MLSIHKVCTGLGMGIGNKFFGNLVIKVNVIKKKTKTRIYHSFLKWYNNNLVFSDELADILTDEYPKTLYDQAFQ